MAAVDTSRTDLKRIRFPLAFWPCSGNAEGSKPTQAPAGAVPDQSPRTPYLDRDSPKSHMLASQVIVGRADSGAEG